MRGCQHLGMAVDTSVMASATTQDFRAKLVRRVRRRHHFPESLSRRKSFGLYSCVVTLTVVSATFLPQNRPTKGAHIILKRLSVPVCQFRARKRHTGHTNYRIRVLRHDLKKSISKYNLIRSFRRLL